MGVITGLLTLPLAPVRGTMRLAAMLERQAEKQLYDESALRAALLELDAMRAAGDCAQDELDEVEEALLERLLAARGMR
jgi:hypothetical protein